MAEQRSATRSGTTRPRRTRPAASPDRSSPKTAAPDGTSWTADELAAVGADLQQQAQELRREIDSAQSTWAAFQRDGGGDGWGDDQADAGSKTFEREHELSLANNSRHLLAQVHRALGRLDDGTYGVCESCGGAVGKARLQAFPRATLCVSCKQREERR